MREITMSTTVLAGLLAAGEASRWDHVLLNPQPLPPRELFPPWLGPWPGPWPRSWTLVTRAVVARHVDRLEQAGIIIVSGDVEHVVRRSADELADYASALTGDAPGRAVPVGPWSSPPAAGPLAALDLVLAGLQLQHAADSLPEHPLHEAFERSATHLIDVGLERAAS